MPDLSRHPRRHPIRRSLRSAATACAAAALVLTAASTADAAVPAHVNFQPEASLVPAGYVADSGAAYDASRGYGWVRQDSVSSAEHVPLDVASRTRERNVVTDQRLDTLVQLQSAPKQAVLVPAAWEADVPTGDYVVTVAAGDPSYLDSVHRVDVEGTPAIANFTPTTANRTATATVTVRVTDGRLTLDAIGGTNTKFLYVDIAPAAPADTTAPAAPGGVAATAGDATVALSWNPSGESDLAGYAVYRSTQSPVPTSGSPLDASLLSAASYTDATAVNGTSYHYAVVAVDTAGNRSAASAEVDATPVAPPPPPPPPPADFTAKVNFQPAASVVPAGYTADSGDAFSAARGSGWVRQDSIASASHVPLDMTTRVRERNVATDQRQDTLIGIQSAPGATALTPGAWEIAVPTGSYVVTVGVGDPSYLDSTDRVNVEGVQAIAPFTPTSANRYATATVTVRVSDGLLTLDGIGGTNTKLDYVDIATAAADTTAPLAPTGLTATPSSNRVVLSWTANGESDLAGYNLYRSTGTPVPTTGAPVNAAPITQTGYTDTTAANGTTYSYALVAVDRSGNASRASAEASATPAASGRIEVANLDGTPFADRLVFNRIGTLGAPPDNGVHDRGTVRVRNTGTSPLTVTALTLTGPFVLLTPASLPVSVAAGAFLDVPVRFVATSGRVSTGTLTVESSDADTPAAHIDLAGYWQRVSEGNQEPTFQEIVNGVFGYRTTITGAGQVLNKKGRIEAVGDEVLSPYWQRANAAQPVGVTQLAAFHTQGNTATLFTYARGTRTTRSLMTHAGIDGQSLLPHRNGSTTAQTTASFTPTSTQFGFKSDSEWSDPLYNNETPDRTGGCLTGCGHHVRFWPVKDRAGVTVPGSYLMTMDYSGINYDYQDNVFLISNITPVVQTAVPRVDTGSGSTYTDTGGRAWAPDTGLFGPTTTPNEGSASAAIANTLDDPIYGTYRGNVGNVPQAQRILDYRIPAGTATTVNVRLHFAERFWTGPGQRVFDVLAEGSTRVDNLDIFAAAGGADTAYVVELPNLPVRDGSLDLSLRAEVDYPSIAGIEVTCATGCTG